MRKLLLVVACVAGSFLACTDEAQNPMGDAASETDTTGGVGDVAADGDDGEDTTEPDAEECVVGADLDSLRSVFENCTSCHSSELAGPFRGGAPLGSNFDDDAGVARAIAAIRFHAIETDTMPPGRPLSDCDQLRLDAFLELLEEGPCEPSCAGRTCSDDGCGGSCGECGDGFACSEAGRCECVPDCDGRTCGNDGCGGSCGSCDPATQFCNAGVCACRPDCAGLSCGDDGCGGTCGTCGEGFACNDGTCACVPDCSGLVCGSDGCGGSCGACAGGQVCDEGACVEPPSFATDIYPLMIASNCGSAGCHGGSVPSAGLNFSSAATAFAELVGQASTQCGGAGATLVAPGVPASSYLVNKLTGVGMCGGTRMPRGRAAWSASDIELLRDWIAGGARP